nr:MAG TPA: hypothetical protein [Caudoviricetes sp.]
MIKPNKYDKIKDLFRATIVHCILKLVPESKNL